MLFFRSEEEARRWTDAAGYPPRPVVSLPQLWVLATTWYSTRLTPQARRPAPEEMRTILVSIGLDDPFWDPAADTFRA